MSTACLWASRKTGSRDHDAVTGFTLAGATVSHQLELPGLHLLQSLDNDLDWMESPELLATSDAVDQPPSKDDVTARIQTLEAIAELASISLADVCQAQAADDNLQPIIQPIIQLLKDQAKPPHSCSLYPDKARVLLLQLDTLVL